MELVEENKIKLEKLNIKKNNWKLKIVLFLIFILFGFEWITILIKPTLIALCKVRSQSLATSISGKVVQEVMGGLRLFRFNNLR